MQKSFLATWSTANNEQCGKIRSIKQARYQPRFKCIRSSGSNRLETMKFTTIKTTTTTTRTAPTTAPAKPELTTTKNTTTKMYYNNWKINIWSNAAFINHRPLFSITSSISIRLERMKFTTIITTPTNNINNNTSYNIN